MNRISGKKALIVIGQKNYDDTEFEHLRDLLTDNGAVVTVTSSMSEKALGRLEGYTVPHMTIQEADPKDYDVLILIGGYGAYVYLWDDENLHQLINKANKLKKTIAAASVAPVALANAGILSGKKATVYPDYNAAVVMLEKGVNHVYEGVVIDDNIITSNHAKKVGEFGEAIISNLEGAK